MNPAAKASGRRGRPKREKQSAQARAAQRRPVFVLNLKRHPERLAFMKRQLDDMRLDFEAVEAVDGQLIPAGERKKLVHGKDDRPAAEVGCLLSHLKAFQLMDERGIPEALILEDDMEFNEDAAEVLNALELPEECRVLQLAGIKDEHFERLHTVCFPGGVSLPRGYAMSPRTGVLYGALAYIIRLSYARRLLREAPPIRDAIDNLMFHFHSNLYLPWAVHKQGASGENRMLGEEKRFSGAEDKSKWERLLWQFKETQKSFAEDGPMLPPGKPGKPPPVFVIDLKQDARALDAVKQQLDEGGIPFQVIEAEERGEQGPGGGGAEHDPLSPPNIDRRRSHLKAHRAALETGAPEAVILEGDISLEDNFAAWLRGESAFRMANTVFRQWWLSRRFISPHRATPLAHASGSARQEKMASGFSTMKYSRLDEAVLYCFARAYIISRPRMRRLLKKAGAGETPIHRVLFRPAAGRLRPLRRILNPEKFTGRLSAFLLRHPQWLHCEEKIRLYELRGLPFALRELIVILSCYSFFPARWRRRPAKSESGRREMRP